MWENVLNAFQTDTFFAGIFVGAILMSLGVVVLLGFLGEY